MGGLTPLLALSAVALLGARAAVADPALLSRLDPEIDQAFFHVAVTGDALDGFADTRSGKAFGIGRNLVITSQHVVGDVTEWQPARPPGTAPEVVRAVRPLSRSIELTRRVDPENPQTNSFVRSVPMSSIDATGVVVPDLEMTPYFQLSICPISTGEAYYALLTLSDDPASVRSVRDVGLVELRAAAFRPPEYGPLNVFDIVGTTDFARETDGHDGSPILDPEGNVVAVVSALTAAGTGHRILATPIQPFFPGAMGMLSLAVDDRRTTGDRLACSLSDTVRRLYENLSSHAFWKIDAKRDREGRIEDIYLEFDTILAEPNIVSVDARIEYLGNDVPERFQEDNAPHTTRLPVPNLQREFAITELKEGETRTFSTNFVGVMGKLFVEPWVQDQAGEAGRIDFVEISIVPRFRNSSIEGRATTFRLPYFTPTLPSDP